MPPAQRRATSAHSRVATGTVRSAFAKPPGPMVSSPGMPRACGNDLVEGPGREATDAHRVEDHVGPVESAPRSVSATTSIGAPGRPAAPAAHLRGHQSESLCRARDEDDLERRAPLDAAGPGRQRIDELRRRRAGSAEDDEAHLSPRRRSRGSATPTRSISGSVSSANMGRQSRRGTSERATASSSAARQGWLA